MVCRINGWSDQWLVGPIVRRTNGVSDQWCVGSMVGRSNGASDQWCLGLLWLSPFFNHSNLFLKEKGFVRLHQFGPKPCLSQHPAGPTPRWSDNTIAQYFLYLNNTQYIHLCIDLIVRPTGCRTNRVSDLQGVGPTGCRQYFNALFYHRNSNVNTKDVLRKSFRQKEKKTINKQHKYSLIFSCTGSWHI